MLQRHTICAFGILLYNQGGIPPSLVLVPNSSVFTSVAVLKIYIRVCKTCFEQARYRYYHEAAFEAPSLFVRSFVLLIVGIAQQE